ncbi:MAG TPA: hypothetical protein VLI06_10260 [Solimonas sp.]|nr:hypothetical protein [Solimonas sp.]
MTMRKIGGLLAAMLLAGCSSNGGDAAPGTAAPVPTPNPPVARNACADPEADIEPSCFLQGNAANLVRTVCGVAWLPGLCNTVAFEDPQYRVEADPHPGAPYFLAIGTVHEHSSYSDGDPQQIPRDYFAAGRDGHNTADAGGDTGIRVDFMLSSEHSDNEKLPVTTSAACIPIGTDLSPGTLSPTVLANLVSCAHTGDLDHYFKWQATLQQALDGSSAGFTAMRGFEWTNDYYNHMNVYLSTNVVNAKVDGSYVGMNFMWRWLQTPVDQGGGADALAAFNHPGSKPALTPFDGDLPHNELLARLGNANWNDLAHVPEVDARVVGIEVNGGDDLSWYVKALQQGWHVGPLGAEDEHQREWSTRSKPKTVMLVRGRDPQDYYHALQNRRTMALRPELVGGAPGEKASFPQIRYWADGSGLQDGIPLGTIVRDSAAHTLHVDIEGLPAGTRVSLMAGDAEQAAPMALGVADAGGRYQGSQAVSAPGSGQRWYFLLLCPAAETQCGSSEEYLGVTAPIWFAPAEG